MCNAHTARSYQLIEEQMILNITNESVDLRLNKYLSSTIFRLNHKKITYTLIGCDMHSDLVHIASGTNET